MRLARNVARGPGQGRKRRLDRPAGVFGHRTEVVTQDRQGHCRAEGVAVPGGGINEELPIACPCVAENALLHDGTAQCDLPCQAIPDIGEEHSCSFTNTNRPRFKQTL